MGRDRRRDTVGEQMTGQDRGGATEASKRERRVWREKRTLQRDSDRETDRDEACHAKHNEEPRSRDRATCESLSNLLEIFRCASDI